MNTAVLSSKDMTWRTPEWLIDAVSSLSPGGHIGLDPATSRENPTKAMSFCAVDTDPPMDGLLPTWRGNGLVFCNPPYGRGISRWAEKFSAEGRSMEQEDQLVTLTPARPDTRWWTHMITADRMCFLRGRVKFLRSDDDGIWRIAAGAPFPCVASYWGNQVSAFSAVFSQHGWIINPSAHV